MFVLKERFLQEVSGSTNNESGNKWNLSGLEVLLDFYWLKEDEKCLET